MIRLLAVFLVVLLAACSAVGQKSTSERSAQSGAAREPDNMCLNDCLGHGGDPQFCRERCTD